MEFADEWAALASIAPAIFRHQPKELEKIKGTPVILVQDAKNTRVRVERVRPWAAEMKKLEMTHDYIEVADGDHGSVVAQNVPKIVDFFGKRKRKDKKKDEK